MQEVQITLKLTADGQIAINATGPGSDNKLTMLGMLEFAKHAITQQGQQPAQPARPPILLAGGPLLRNGGA